jgi:hypothetical protein
MFTDSASSAVLNRNDTAPCAVTVRRTRFDVTATSDTCEVMPMTSEKSARQHVHRSRHALG